MSQKNKELIRPQKIQGLLSSQILESQKKKKKRQQFVVLLLRVCGHSIGCMQFCYDLLIMRQEFLGQV